MKQPKITIQTAKQSGSFIIEAMISLLLFAVGLVGLMALSAQSLNQVSQSKARNDASYIAGELIAEMWVSASVNLTTWQTRLDSVIPGATANVYMSTCDCVDTVNNVCTTPATGTVVIAPQPTICINGQRPNNLNIHQQNPKTSHEHAPTSST
jgi:type IV pilus assembly protein PilV